EALAEEVGERPSCLLDDGLGQVLEPQGGHPLGKLAGHQPASGDGVVAGTHAYAGSVPWPMRTMKRPSLARTRNSAMWKAKRESGSSRETTVSRNSANTYQSCTTRSNRSTDCTSYLSNRAP